ncbi:MAG: hypothetical protein SFV15_15975 [Polyangiaceae bacterium]|nr:hypothetical protein [Polyangiaceae bacterium]
MPVAPRTLAWGLLASSTLALVGVCLQPPRPRAKPEGKSLQAQTLAKKLPPLAALRMEPLGPVARPIAFVGVPIGATGSRPVHLVFPWRGSARERCLTWREVVGEGVFVLCPELPLVAPHPGEPSASRFPDVDALAARIRDSLRAAKARFGQYLDKGSITVAAEGEAAERAVQISRTEPSFFSRLLLLDGGYKAWSPVQVQVFSERGGLRVGFVCKEGTGCGEGATHPVVVSRRFGIDARVSSVGAAVWGTPPALQGSFAWLVRDDLRFSVLKKP